MGEHEPGGLRPSRRQVLVAAASLSLARTLGPPAWLRWASAEPVPAAAAGDPVTDLLRAYVATLVPGPADDPAGAAGGVEAGGVEQLQEQVPYVIPLLVTDLTAAALTSHGVPFADLAYAEREALVVDAFADPTRAPHHLIALAIGAGTFYGDFRNRVGGEHLGFPGPSDGYLATYTDRTGHGQPQADAVPA